MGQQIEKRACPFCGGQGEEVRDHTQPAIDVRIKYTRCGAQTASDDSWLGAWALLNRREPMAGGGCADGDGPSHAFAQLRAAAPAANGLGRPRSGRHGDIGAN